MELWFLLCVGGVLWAGVLLLLVELTKTSSRRVFLSNDGLQQLVDNKDPVV